MKRFWQTVKFILLFPVLLVEGIVFWWQLWRESKEWGDGWSEEADDAAELDEWRSWYE